jgi:hypothetical protein
MKINLHGLLAFLTSAGALALSPAVFNILPPKAAAIVAGVGIIYQAVTKPAAQPTPVPAPTPAPTS